MRNSKFPIEQRDSLCKIMSQSICELLTVFFYTVFQETFSSEKSLSNCVRLSLSHEENKIFCASDSAILLRTELMMNFLAKYIYKKILLEMKKFIK